MKTTGDSYIIRSARETDAEDIYKVYRAAVRSLEYTFASKELVHSWADAVSPDAIRIGLKTPDTIGFVAARKGDVIGFAALHKTTVRALYVHPEYQTIGVGSGLLTRVEASAAAGGVHLLKLNAAVGACSFYESHGYHILRKAPFAFGEALTLDSFEMAKPIV